MNKAYYERRKFQMEQKLKKKHIAMVQSGNNPDKVESFNQALGKLVKFTEKERLDKFDIMSDSLLAGSDGNERCPLCQYQLEGTSFTPVDIKVNNGENEKIIQLRLMRCPSCKFSIHVAKHEDGECLKGAQIV